LAGVREKHCWLVGSWRLLLEWCERKTVGCLEQQRSERGENLLLASLPRGGSADAAGQVGGGATTAAAASSTVRAFDRSRPEEAGDRALQEEAVDEGEPGGRAAAAATSGSPTAGLRLR